MRHNEYQERITLEEFSALLERDLEHRYELIDGYPYMMTEGSPDHSISGANMARILGEQLRHRPCIAYNSDVYIELADEANCLCPDASVSCERRDRRAQRLSAILA
jgi:Uma2 family endonuclease